MRRMVALMVVLGVMLVEPAVPVSARSMSGPRPAAKLYLPSAVPDGWYVWRAVPPTDTSGAGTSGAGTSGAETSGDMPAFTYYARRSDPAHGRALAVGIIGSGDGFDHLRGSEAGPVAGLPDNRMRRNGPFTWLSWAGPGEDEAFLVAGRELDDEEMIEAARAMRETGMDGSGVPEGLDRLVAADIGPDYAAPAEGITLVDKTGMRHVGVDVYAGAPVVRAMQEFWVEQSSRRERKVDGLHRAVVGPQKHAIIVARGDASRSELRQLARSMRPTDDAGWQAFRRRVADLPVTALLPGPWGRGVVLDGALDGTRWAIAFGQDLGPTFAATMMVTADLSSGGGTNGVPDGPLPDALSAGGVLTNGGGIFAGVIPAGAASATFLPDGQPPVEAVLGPTTRDGTHRYFAAWVPDVAGTVPLVVHDHDGNVLVQRAKFGCNVCD